MRIASAKAGPIMRPELQLMAYVIFGFVLPVWTWAEVRSVSAAALATDGTAFQLIVANLAVWYFLNRLRSYARARLLSYVLPANIICFGAVLGVNALARTGFSWSLLLPCAFATLAVSYLVTAKVRHANPGSRHFVVPGGNISALVQQDGFVQLQTADELERLVRQNLVTGSVVADLHDEKAPEWERAIARAALSGVPVYHYRLIEEELTGEVRINHLRENDLGSLIPNLPYRTVKRAIDIAGAMVLMPVLLPLMAIIALLIRMDGAGPIIFRQERLGYRGENFTMIKFRTMRERVVSDHDDARRDDAITRDSDDRITRVGGFLRKTRLDELPQVWNILRGDMSWIGPRPEARALADWYEAEIPFYAYRHIVRPGITGWAQVNQGHVAGIDDVHTKLRFDFYYVKNLSLWLDILIALKTLRVIVSGIGAK